MPALPITTSTPTSPPPSESGIDTRTLTLATLPAMREPILSIAAQAFAASPWNETPADALRLVNRMYEATAHRDFTAVAAFDGTDMVAFAYGYTDDRLTAMSPGPAPKTTPTTAFELIELAVAPACQGQGIGKTLHDTLLTLTPTPRLLLTHPEAPARRAYQRWGWTELGEVPSPTGHPVVLMRHG